MKEYWSKKARGLEPYTPGEQPVQKLVKLNTNENAYPPSPKVAAAVAAEVANLRLYPNPDAQVLRQTVADYHGLRPEQVFCFNGSDEALALCFLAFFDPGRPIKTLDITYSFYPVWAELFDLTLDRVALTMDYTADVAALTGGTGVVLANPNAPTGIAVDLDSIERIVRGTDGVVIVDEAYIAFGGQSADKLVEQHKNLAVVRTLSKSHSLAGLRVGYVLADEGLIQALAAVKDSFNSYPVDRLAQVGAIAAIEDTAYYNEVTCKIVADREETRRALEKLGLTVLPSSANFLFVQCADAADVFTKLREQGILVRYFPGGRTKDFLRVTIGTNEQMQAFIAAMKGIV